MSEEGRDKEHPDNWKPSLSDALKAPFPAEDIDWRIQSCGKNARGVWAKCLAYVTSRAVQDRLDEVCGPEGWQTVIQPIDGGFLAGIGIEIDGQWVWKYDGAQTTDIEKIKGGISGAIKRAAVQWGIGRYLYNLKTGYANIAENGVNWQKGKSGDYDAFNWNPPALPVWALPEGHKNAERGAEPEKAPDTPESQETGAEGFTFARACIRVNEQKDEGIERKSVAPLTGWFNTHNKDIQGLPEDQRKVVMDAFNEALAEIKKAI